MKNLANRCVLSILALTAIAFVGLALVNAQTAADADFDGNGTVGFSDFVAFAGYFGTSLGDGRYDAKYDLNGDGQVGFADFVAFAGFFGKSARPDTARPAAGFDLHVGNSYPLGITYANDRFYVVASELNDAGVVAGSQKVYAYSRTGERDRASDFDLADDIFPVGIAYANDRFYVTTIDEKSSGYEKVYVYSRSGRRHEASDFVISDETDAPLGVTFANDKLYVAINPEYTDVTKVFAYDVSGKRDTSSDFDLFDEVKEDALPHGITYANERLYVVVISGVFGSSPASRTVYAYRLSGKRDPASDFDLEDDNGNAFGIVYANDSFYVVDSVDRKVYTYAGTERQSSVPNDPPVLERIGDQGVPIGVPLNFELSATDPDGDDLRFRVSGSPPGASFSGTRFQSTPTGGIGDVYTVNFTVDDGRGGTDSETVSVRVVDFRFKFVVHRIATEAPSFVNILFQVLDLHNWGVTALSAEHFEVRDQLVSPSESAMRVQKRKALTHRFKPKTVLMLDTSTSVKDHLEQIKEAAIVMVENMTENQEIALYEFSEAPVLL